MAKKGLKPELEITIIKQNPKPLEELEHAAVIAEKCVKLSELNVNSIDGKDIEHVHRERCQN